MNRASWLASVNGLFASHGSRRVMRRQADSRRRRARSPVGAYGGEQLEERRVMAFDLVSAYADSETPFYVSGQTAPTLLTAPQQITLRFTPGVQIDTNTLAGNISIVRSGAKDDAFGAGGAKADVPVTPGIVLVNDSPNENQIVIRFQETLPDDSYQITIGGGLKTVATVAEPAQSFRNGTSASFDFRLELGGFVVSVVPQPVSRDGSGLTQARDQIAVYFNSEDPLDPASAINPASYRVFEVDPATGSDVAATDPINPVSVVYSAATGQAVLTFASSGAGSLADGKLYRLQVGGAEALLPTAAAVPETAADHSSFVGAQSLGSLTAAGASVTGAIAVKPTVATPSGSLGFPTQPGTIDEPGHREIPSEPTADSGHHGLGAWGTGDAGAVAVQSYNFQDVYGVDPYGNVLHNAITETQKQRAREVFELFSRYTGIRFVETDSSGITVATGDVRANGSTIPPTAVAGISSGNAIMNSSIDWGASEYGGYWFQVAMHEIGHALGLEHSYDLPTIMGRGLAGEGVYPGDYDLVHLAQLYPSTGNDVDVYSFTLPADGAITAQTFVARPGQPVVSTLDSVLTLYRQDPATGRRVMVARNDDYYGRDSFIGLDLAARDSTGAAYTYYIAVTSTGNTAFDPQISGSGYGGRSDGQYRLQLDFKPTSTVATTIVDTKGSPLDGDRDGKQGGAFNFWFKTAAATATVFVDKATTVAVSQQDGSLAKPYASIKAALAAVNAANGDADATNDKSIIRIVGNDASLPYLIGTKPGTSQPLDATEGTTFNVPKGVTVMIDEGAIFKLRSAVIDVGSSSPLVSRAGAALQVLGTPGKNVYFTSYHDDSIGGNSDGVGPAAVGGQWGGIVFREDSDFAAKTAFVNAVSQARLLYGGGNVTVDSQLSAYAPIQLESARPTLAFNTITNSAGAAIAADPNSFEDSNGRVGPEIRGNTLLQNTINGLFVNIRTRFGQPVDTLDVPARLKSTDIVYVVQENLFITGGAGGYEMRIDPADGLTKIYARQSGRLAIDPGVVVKLQGARIELERGESQLIAEGTAGQRVVFTSLGDNRFGAGGTFDTNGNQPDVSTAGDWGGIVLDAGSRASIDHAYVAFGGGQTAIEGGFDTFNVIEVHQGDLRLAHSRIENNAAGTATTNRDGRGGNAAATVFVRGAQPVVLGNDFRNNLGAVVSVNANSLTDAERPDPGRSTGAIDRDARYDDNVGPLVRGNVLPYAGGFQGGTTVIVGMQVRGEEITVQSVWDDVDIVHVLKSEIIVQNFHTATGIRLVSQTNGSLVVKLDGTDAGFTAAGYGLDIQDRIGGTVQVVGQPGYPVVLTSIKDDSIGAGLDPLGRLVKDTNQDSLAAQPTVPSPGDWRSLKFLPLSNDRNVSILRERESPATGGIDVNTTPDAAEVLGVLAPNFATGTNSTASAQEKSGDDNRRLGFEVHGRIASDMPTDVDVYSFTGYAGSEVWIDLDKTSTSLDAMVELLDAAGNVRARSMDSGLEGGVQQDFSVTGVVDGVDPAKYTFQLSRTTITAGSLSGTITATFNGNVVTQQYWVNAAGSVTFADQSASDFETNRAVSGSIDRSTGVLTLQFTLQPDVAPAVNAAYTYQTSGAFSATTLGIAQPLAKEASLGGDYWSVNPKDPGMRVILPAAPGQGTGAPTQYYIRVRSQPRYDAVGENGGTPTSQAAYEAALQADPTQSPNGATSGRYTLSVRLGQRDEVPGSTVRYADIRYPDIGIDAQGLPHNSPLTGENGENATDANNIVTSAQYVGNLLQTDHNTISIAGSISSSTDVDWYSFALNYEQIQSIAGVNGSEKSWATVFDLDYGDGFRGDLTISVFDSTGKLIYTGRDSNVQSDQPGTGQGTDFDDLSRGSAGKLDPFIGSVMMPAGTPTGSGSVESAGAAIPPDPTKQLRYFVMVSSNERLPAALDATFRSTATNSLIRLEPVNSVQRVVEDHIGSTGYSDAAGNKVAPTGTALIDTATATSLDTSVRAFTLADVTLFVSTNGTISTVDAKTGASETTLNPFSPYTASLLSVGDLDMRPDGRLYAYAFVGNDTGNAGRLLEINTGDGTITATSNDGIASKAASGPTNIQTNSNAVQAVAFRRTDVGDYNDLWLVIYDQDFGGSKLYKAANGGTAASGGAVATASQGFNDPNALGYRGNIVLDGTPISVTGLQFTQDSGGTLYGVTADGKFVSIAPAGKPGSDTAPNTLAQATLVCDYSTELAGLGGGTTGFTALAAAPQNLYDGLFRGQFFALTNTGRLVLLNPNGPTAQKATGDLNGTTTVSNVTSAIGTTAGLTGTLVFGTGIAASTTVQSVNAGAGTVTLSKTATQTVAGGTLAFVRPAATHNGSTTFGSTTVTNLTVTNLAVGMVVIGNGIPDGAVITAIDRVSGSFTLSQAATATSASTTLRFLAAANMPTEIAVERNGTTALASTVVTIDTTDLFVGMGVTGAGVPDGATIIAVDAANRRITLSQPAYQDGTSYLKFYDLHATRAGDADGTTTVSGLPFVDDLRRGMLVFGAGVPLNTTITAIDRVTKAITLSQSVPAGVVDLAFVNASSLGYVADWAQDNNASPVMGSGLTGLAFSPLDVNLWHPTQNRSGEAGHGINAAPDDSRSPSVFAANPQMDVDRSGNSQTRSISQAAGGASMWFGLEQWTGSPAGSQKYWVYNTTGNDAGQFGAEAGGSYDWQRELTANPAIGDNYNLPGGAYGSTITNPFSLAGSVYADKPTLYFNYFLDAQKASGSTVSSVMRDSARVFISTDNGSTWELLATNNTVKSNPDTENEELPTFLSASSRMSYNGNQKVQQLYDVGSWRQARIDLGDYAGRSNLRLRFDFSTAGEFDASQRDAYGNLVNDIAGPAGTTGDFKGTVESRQRGQNNDHEGFYFDDIIIGYAERGEMVTGAVANQTAVFDVGTPGPSQSVPAQNLQGAYQLEIRRGTQYGGIVDPVLGGLGIFQTLPTNADLVTANGLLGDANPIRQQGQFVVESNVISNARTYGISIDAGDPTLQRDSTTNAPNQGVPRNLPVLNGGRLVPGAVIVNNVIAKSGTAGILFSGDPNTGNVPAAAVPYGRIVNNTITGGLMLDRSASITNGSTTATLASTTTLEAGMLVSGTGIQAGTVIASVLDGTRITLSRPATATSAAATLRFKQASTAGTGVVVSQNAGPTLLNNLFANLATGVNVDASSRVDASNNLRTVIGTSAYYSYDGSMVQVTGATQSQQVALATDPFVSAATGNYYLASGSRAIDSSLDSLGDRSELVVVTSPLGIPQSPILAPGRDLFGQLRGDDPNQASVAGLGSNVFKDRGAIDRVDFTQPTAALLEPQDNSTLDKNPADDVVRLEKADANSITRFVLQLNDSGVGIDKATVTKSAFTLTRDGVTLKEGVDYVFQYLETNNQVVFESDSVYPFGQYVIRATSSASTPTAAGMLTDLANNPLLPNKIDGSTSFTIELADVPGIPTNVIATLGDEQVTLAWTAPPANGTPISDYLIQYSTNGGTSWTTFNDGVSAASTVVVTGLANGTSYVFRLAAVNAVGTGLYTPATAPVIPHGLPTAPLNLAAVASDGRIDLTWTVPVKDGGAAITDYLVQYSTDGTTWTTFDEGVSTVTSAGVTGLANGTSYFLRVAGRTQYGDGVFATTEAVKPFGVPAAPGRPVAVAADGQASISWAAANDMGAAVTNYLVQYRAVGSVAWTDLVQPESAATTATIPSLDNGTSYVFRVAAVNVAGTGGWSIESNAVTPGRPATAPLSVTAVPGDASATLSWSTPDDAGGLAITGYRIEYRTASGVVWAQVSVGLVNQATVRGLVNGTPYVFRVSAITNFGVGQASAETSSVTPRLPLLAPTSVTAVRGNGSATVSWRAPSSNAGSAIVGYDIQYSSNGGQSWTAVPRVSASTLTRAVTGLDNATSYIFQVAAVNGFGRGAWSNSVTLTGPASAPSLSAMAGNGSVQLSWTVPVDLGGRSLTGYRIEYRASTAARWIPLSVGLVNSRTVTGLTNGTSYVFRVAAVTGFGTGLFSSQTALQKPIGPAAAPTSLKATAGIGRVTLSWAAPTVTGGSSITGYVVQYRLANSATWTDGPALASSARSTVVSGLTKGLGYVFRVAAVTSFGTGSFATSTTVKPT